MWARRGSRRFGRLASCALWLAASVSPAMGADARARFIADNRCQITLRLDMIHTQPGAPDRFLALSAARTPGNYVQCLLIENDTQMLCEAASGYYSVPAGTTPPGVPLARVAVMEAAGFSTDVSNGNFQKLLTVTDPAKDFEAVADLLLGLLYDGFGARPQDELRYAAPLARLPKSSRGQTCPSRISSL